MSETHLAKVSEVPDLVAVWDFSEPEGATLWKSKAGTGEFPLRVGDGAPKPHPEGPLSGRSLEFDGEKDFLFLPNAELGDLNISGKGASVSVVAWVWRVNPLHSFVGGIWQEHDGDPRRQYGLFIHLPLYGGKDNVCGHVSQAGGASPGLPYSRDYSANISSVPFREWVCAAFTYDGIEARSYLNGVFEPRPEYKEPDPPKAMGWTYSKNPYRFEEGLGDNGGDFTVGAVLLTRGMGNHFGGRIGGLAVFRRALPPDELQRLATNRMRGNASA